MEHQPRICGIHHRLRTLGVEWVVYVTDLGQAEHFHMCFEAARAAKWDDASAHVRLHHVGFGVVCGQDKKRFKTDSTLSYNASSANVCSMKHNASQSFQLLLDLGSWTSLSGLQLWDTAAVRKFLS